MATSQGVSQGKQTRAIVSFVSVGVAILVGLPIWWNTTKVYRATLPYAEIELLSSLKLSVQVNLLLIFVQDNGTEELVDKLKTQLNSNNNNATDLRVKFKYVVNSRQSEQQENEMLNTFIKPELNALDDHLQELWNSHEKNQTNAYTFLILPKDGTFSSLAHYTQCFVGKYRHAIVFHDDDLAHIAERISHVMKTIFIPEHIIFDSLGERVKKENIQDSIEEIRDLKSTTGFHLSFSLINDEPETGILTWNIKEAVAEILQPLLNKMSHFDITLDSQVLHYSGVNLQPKHDGEVSYLTTEDLPHMINPIEAKLGSFVSFNPSLNFILFVPPEHQSPLKIRNDDGTYSSTNAFLSPRWGGVLIHNVLNRSRESTPRTISLDIRSIMEVFLSQIRLLIGIRPMFSEKGVLVTSIIDSGARDWEVNNLLLTKTVEYLSSSIKTLTSLTELIDKVKNMVIDDSIKDEIEQALRAITQCEHELSRGNIVKSFVSAKKAIQSSEKAFFDPSVLELLYFPDDQKFAIYIPLFLPISLPLLVSLHAAIKWLKNKDDGDNKEHVKQS